MFIFTLYVFTYNAELVYVIFLLRAVLRSFLFAKIKSVARSLRFIFFFIRYVTLALFDIKIHRICEEVEYSVWIDVESIKRRPATRFYERKNLSFEP